MRKSASSVTNREELARHLEAHHKRILTAKSWIDSSAPESLEKHIKGRARTRVRKAEVVCKRKDKQTESCGRLIAWPVENGTFDNAGNGTSNGVTGTDSSSNIHNPYWQYLNSIESSSRSELYHSRTGKMAAHRQHSPKRYLSSIPPWKPAGLSFSTPTKYPYLDASSPTPRLKKTTKKTSSKTTPPNASCVYGTVSVVDLQPLERMPCEKRVSFLESAIPTPEGISTSPSHEGTPGHVESPSPESTSSHVESPSPSHVESPSPEGTPSHVESPSSSHVESPSPEGTSNHVESPSPEGTPSHVESPSSSHVESPSPEGTSNHVESPSPEGTPSHVESPSPEGTSSHTESPSPEGTPSHVESPSPEGTPSHVESTPNHLGSTPSSEGIYESIVPQTAWWCGDIGKTSNGIQLLSEATKLSQCSDKLLKQLEEARKRMDARHKEGQYLHFLSEVTRDILSRGVLSGAALDILFRSHVESRCHKLDKEVLLQKIEELKVQLGVVAK